MMDSFVQQISGGKDAEPEPKAEPGAEQEPESENGAEADAKGEAEAEAGAEPAVEPEGEGTAGDVTPGGTPTPSPMSPRGKPLNKKQVRQQHIKERQAFLLSKTVPFFSKQVKAAEKRKAKTIAKSAKKKEEEAEKEKQTRLDAMVLREAAKKKDKAAKDAKDEADEADAVADGKPIMAPRGAVELLNYLGQVGPDGPRSLATIAMIALAEKFTPEIAQTAQHIVTGMMLDYVDAANMLAVHVWRTCKLPSLKKTAKEFARMTHAAFVPFVPDPEPALEGEAGEAGAEGEMGVDPTDDDNEGGGEAGATFEMEDAAAAAAGNGKKGKKGKKKKKKKEKEKKEKKEETDGGEDEAAAAVTEDALDLADRVQGGGAGLKKGGKKGSREAALSREECDALFVQIDADGNGQLSLKEVKAGIKVIKSTSSLTRSAKNIFGAADASSDKMLDADEFYEYMSDATEVSLLSILHTD